MGWEECAGVIQLYEKVRMKKILVTGSAGFIGMHSAIRLAKDGYDVVGIDNLNTYYSVDLKLAR